MFHFMLGADKSTFSLDREKLKQVILYTCSRVDSSRLGATKLHKVLYFSDMLRYAEVGTPMMGGTYRKRPHGPTCDQLLNSLRELERSNSLGISEVDYFGFRKKEFHTKCVPNFDKLDGKDIHLLDEVIFFVCENNTAKTISDFSHNRAWELTEFGEIIRYSSVFLIFPNEVSQEALDWAEGEAGRLAIEKSDISAIPRNDFGDFRKRVFSSR